jgi:hypothetical protein
MTTSVGASTSYQLTVPSLSETADIQVALRLLSYGSSTDPANDAAIGANSLTGYIKSLSTLKAPLASPTFTGTVTLPTGTSSAAPLKVIAGTNLTTPAYGSIEATTDALFITTNPGSTTTGPGRGIVHAPQMVISLANSTNATSTTGVSAFASANDTLSILTAAKLYRFKGTYYVSYTANSVTNAVNLLFTFSNAPQAIKYNFKTYTQTANAYTNLMGASSTTANTAVSASSATDTSYVVEFEGYFVSHASSTSTLIPQISQTGTTSTTAVTAGSWFEVAKIGTSTQTLIAGNWA